MSDDVNWAGNLRYSARRVHRPHSIEELRAIVAGSRGLRPLGTRHSFSAIADTTGDLVDVTRLPAELEIDPDAATVTLSAGSRYGDIAPRLEAAGWALANMGSLPHISVGGATATGTHGSGDRLGTLSSQVAAVEFVTADGSSARLRRGEPGFEGAVVHLGLLGVAVRVTLDLVPSFALRQEQYEGLAWGTVYERFDEIMASGYSVSLFTTWLPELCGSALVKTAEELPEEFHGARPRAVPKDEGEARAEADADSGTRKGGVLGAWHDRLPHFRLDAVPSVGDELQSEYLVPRPAALEALRLVHELGESITPQLHATEIRTVAADDLWLSGAGGRDAVAIGFTWKPRPREVGALLPRIEERLLPLGGRPHWGKLIDTRELEAVYDRLDDFRALADEYDPRGKLRNRFLDERVFGG